MLKDFVTLNPSRNSRSRVTLFAPLSSSRSFRSEIDEKYPENWSRESLMDFSSISNLPPVPENIFFDFSKPARTSSVSSLKSIRKVKLYLQRVVTSEDDESECEDHDLSISDEPMSGSDASDSRSTSIGVKKRGGDLHKIKEEWSQDESYREN